MIDQSIQLMYQTMLRPPELVHISRGAQKFTTWSEMSTSIPLRGIPAGC